MNQDLPQPPPKFTQQQAHHAEQGICSYLSRATSEIIVNDADENEHFFPLENDGLGYFQIGQAIRNMPLPARIELVDYPPGNGFIEIRKHRVTLLPPRRHIFFYDGHTTETKEGRDAIRRAGKQGMPPRLGAGLYKSNDQSMKKIMDRTSWQKDFDPVQNPLEPMGA